MAAHDTGGFPPSMFEHRATSMEKDIAFLAERSKEDRGKLDEVIELSRKTASDVSLLTSQVARIDNLALRTAALETWWEATRSKGKWLKSFLSTAWTVIVAVATVVGIYITALFHLQNGQVSTH